MHGLQQIPALTLPTGEDLQHFFTAAGMVFNPRGASVAHTVLGLVLMMATVGCTLAAIRFWNIYNRSVPAPKEACGNRHWEAHIVVLDGLVRSAKFSLMGALFSFGMTCFLCGDRALTLGMNAPTGVDYNAMPWPMPTYRLTLAEWGMYGGSLIVWSAILFGIALLCGVAVIRLWLLGPDERAYLSLTERWKDFWRDMRPEKAQPAGSQHHADPTNSNPYGD